MTGIRGSLRATSGNNELKREFLYFILDMYTRRDHRYGY